MITIKLDIKSMQIPALEEYMKSLGEAPYRAKQVFKWLHSGAVSFDAMTNLPADLRTRLDDECYITVPELVEKQVSAVDGTVKYLWGLKDKALIECVVMEQLHGITICISTQAGCRMGCTFCASAINGFERDLTASEMIDQVLFTQPDYGKRLSNIVLMGIGEPLDNLENVISFLGLISSGEGVCIGARHITISTCGIVENIDKLAQYDVQSTLAVSLHAPDDRTRSLLMPVNRNTGVDKLFAACQRYFKKTGRRITYEYAMIDGVNDSAEQARLLAERLGKTGCHLNLILLSDVPERALRASSRENVRAFTDILRHEKINFTVRRSLGADIEAACGQLRRRREYKE